MTVYHDLSEVSLPASVLTIGSFDGLHLGHQALIRSWVEGGRAERLPSAVVTFYPHPSVVLRARRPAFYITLPEEKTARLPALGVDPVVPQRFDEALSRVSAGEFLDRLEARLHFQRLWIGEGFALGHEREGSRLFLRREAERRGFSLHEVPPAKVGGEVVSSTRVREALRAGDVARVATYLGRPFVLRGPVVRGAARGGWRTAGGGRRSTKSCRRRWSKPTSSIGTATCTTSRSAWPSWPVCEKSSASRVRRRWSSRFIGTSSRRATCSARGWRTTTPSGMGDAMRDAMQDAM